VHSYMNMFLPILRSALYPTVLETLSAELPSRLSYSLNGLASYLLLRWVHSA